MALGPARGRSGRRTGVAYNPSLLTGATRLDRALRLEHDPRPGQSALLARGRGFFSRWRPCQAAHRGAPPSVRMSFQRALAFPL